MIAISSRWPVLILMVVLGGAAIYYRIRLFITRYQIRKQLKKYIAETEASLHDTNLKIEILESLWPCLLDHEPSFKKELLMRLNKEREWYAERLKGLQYDLSRAGW